ncbi:SDR family oxidoreductase [Glycomyces tenuis]|uniref:SDR family oxidoreductase n=1 Tax=Glycomyces tenuis TaxID=58116 RepID=UPI00047EFE19|nr:SDR family oxidoreductase [Glycomyces tenuis]
MRIRGAVVVITGASSGIGKATALAFAKEGASLMLAARRKTALEDTVAACEALDAPATAVEVDVTDADAVDGLADAAVRRFGSLDVWVNNAAVTMFSPFLEMPPEDLRRLVDVNVFGYVNGARAALPWMREQGSGVLINVSSIATEAPRPYTSAYDMSKAAIRSLSASLRGELMLEGEPGVHVCTVLPATVDTPIFDHAANRTGRAVRPMPPVSSPQRVARAIVKTAKSPRREVLAGTGARQLAMMRKRAPGLTERLMAGKVDRRHLSRKRSAEDTDGNLYEPSAEDASATGGWGGRRRTAQRGIAMAAAAGLAGALLFGKLRRDRLTRNESRC